MSHHDPSAPSLLELFRRAVRRHTEAQRTSPASPAADHGDRIISRRDEKGVPYKGDVPDPTRGTYRGCF